MYNVIKGVWLLREGSFCAGKKERGRQHDDQAD
jgi:hypothetical protein